MKTLLKTLALAALLAASALAGMHLTRPRPVEAAPTAVTEWPMDARDRMAWDGIDSQFVLLDRDVASVVSDARVRGAIFRACMDLQFRADELAAEAGHARGVAVVRSGSTWVARR